MSSDAQSIGRYANRWLPGVSGNPLGSTNARTPNLLGQLKKKLLAAADRKAAEGDPQSPFLVRDQIINEMLRLALHSNDDRVRFAAIKEIFDRTEGKPLQRVEVIENDQRDRYLSCIQFVRDSLIKSGKEVDERLILEAVCGTYPEAREVLADMFAAADGAG